MKKTYIKPSVECFNVNAQSIIATSPGSNPLALDDDTVINNDNKDDFSILGREDNSVSNTWDSEW